MEIQRRKRGDINRNGFGMVADDLHNMRSAILGGLEETNDGFEMSFWIKLGKL